MSSKGRKIERILQGAVLGLTLWNLLCDILLGIKLQGRAQIEYP